MTDTSMQMEFIQHFIELDLTDDVVSLRNHTYLGSYFEHHSPWLSSPRILNWLWKKSIEYKLG